MVAAYVPEIDLLAIAELVPELPELRTPLSPVTARAALAGTINGDGLGMTRALDLYHSFVVANSNAQGGVRSLAYVPNAPCAEAVVLDSLLSGATFMGTSWQEASGAVAAENQALRWLADLIGYDERAGGTFVAGGTIANVTALAVAAHRMRAQYPGEELAVAASSEVHSSVRMATKML